MNHHNNIVRIKSVARALGELKELVVFVGGATLSLYPTSAVSDPRPTDDVDIIIEILNYSDRIKLEDKLRSLGFSHDNDSMKTTICRYKIEGIVVDIMPTDDPSIGFTNKWYPEGFTNSVTYKIDNDLSIKILTASYFIATKLEAFKGRGGNDGRSSHDFEDIVFVLENREPIWEEMKYADVSVRNYLCSEFQFLLNNPNLFEWIDCHVERGTPPASYFIMEELRKFAS
jgi:predicted nucleotidyltransferase